LLSEYSYRKKSVGIREINERRILKIGLCLTSAPGYSETFIRSKIKGLLEAGFDVQVFLFNRSSVKDDIRYHNPFPLKFPLVLFYFPLVLLVLMIRRFAVSKRFIQLEQKDGKKMIPILKSLYINGHIFLQGKLDWLHFAFATIAIDRENIALAMNTKLAISIRGFDIGLYPLTHPGCYNKLWKRVQKVHTISDDLFQLALENGLPANTPFQKIRPAIDIAKLKPKNNPGEIQNPIQILSIGRLEWKKGFVYALEAMHVLQQRGVKFKYSIVGSGSTQQELLYAVRDLKLENSVSLVGKVTHDEIFKLLHQSDIYIQPSVQEGFCNALLEAQGSAILCVATNAEGLSENVLHEQTGWIVNKRDGLALASKIEDILIMDSKRRKEIAEASRERVSSEFKIDRLVEEFKEFYKN
jgi:colanic acid/amylovoran biosynthesis glycosyltransferase